MPSSKKNDDPSKRFVVLQDKLGHGGMLPGMRTLAVYLQLLPLIGAHWFEINELYIDIEKWGKARCMKSIEIILTFWSSPKVKRKIN